MITIGSNELIVSSTLFVRDNERANIDLPTDDDHVLRLGLVFTRDASKSLSTRPKATVSLDGNGSTGLITFRNWLSSTSMPIANPIRIATSDSGEFISLMGNVAKLGEIYRVEFQILKGQCASHSAETDDVPTAA